ncbi:ADP-heptose:LPS heptosyltransferase [Pedobacter steynii]|uniref:ADP-heptose:LPS heptosyltransferase n=1 Tax=Pedobacter steynii TaxID=430522 RepID=A0A1G9SEE9_9SPHI|nr:glycosyltransferase family 9 protein [Pedobacter steynii]NQX37450.1 glycosyltransferase family 9 protein [Pedobacter steynii]SDM33697.1 ADP-heptose:LPS heptosyltransferase [Pedobacter steynii]
MKFSKKEIKKIGIFRALQLGDLLCSIPAMRSLRAAYPNAKIYFIGLPETEAVIKRLSHYLDDFIPFPGYPGLPEQPFDEENFHCFLAKIQAINFDLILQMQGNSNLLNQLIKSFNTRYLAGFCRDRSDQNDCFLSYPDDGPEIQRQLSLVEHLGIPLSGDELEFPLFPADHQHLEQLRLPIGPGAYVCIHPGSKGSWKQWPSIYFACIANYCADLGFKVLLTGSLHEMQLVQHVADLMKTKPIICAGKTTLGSLAVLIKQAAAVISNATEISEIATALDTPSMYISMDKEPFRWGKSDQRLNRIIDWNSHPDFRIVHQEVVSLFGELQLFHKSV